jgi:hypothetical protein
MTRKLCLFDVKILASALCALMLFAVAAAAQALTFSGKHIASNGQYQTTADFNGDDCADNYGFDPKSVKRRGRKFRAGNGNIERGGLVCDDGYFVEFECAVRYRSGKRNNSGGRNEREFYGQHNVRFVTV